MAVSLTIDTVLGRQLDFSDRDSAPLMLAGIQANEAISAPYAYDCTLYRPMKLPAIQPSTLINTPVTIGLRQGDVSQWLYRRGVISAMNRVGVSNQEYQIKTDFYVYSVRVVPAFKVLDNETVFRAFENRKLLDLISELLTQTPMAAALASSTYINSAALTEQDNPSIPYCVQFNESTFNFISRLLAQFGICYYYDHHSTDRNAKYETMVLAKSFADLQPCAFHGVLTVEEFSIGADKITNFGISTNPTVRHVWVADFNESNPTQPPAEPDGGGDRDIDPAFDVRNGDKSLPDAASRFQFQQFPNNGDSTTLMRSLESGVTVAQGQTKNRSFYPAQTFLVSRDATSQVSPNTMFAITAQTFTAVEFELGHYVLGDVASFFVNALALNSVLPFVTDIFDGKPAQSPDVLGGLASQGLTNYLGNMFSNGPEKTPFFPAFGAGAGAGGLGVLASWITGALKTTVQSHSDTYAVAFMATPWNGITVPLPLPSAKQPQVGGPHLAVVIGPKGVDESELGQIYTHENKVRIRFGWQRFVPLKGPDSTVDPLASEFCAAWARVSQGWAGQQYGNTFYPRIGDEVVVGFVDGDPSRPLVIGRLYNDFAAPPFDQNEYRTGIKTQSQPKPHDYKGPERFNLLRFDDRFGKEQMLLRAQGRLDITSYNSTYFTTMGNWNMTVKTSKDDHADPKGGAALISTDGNFNLNAGGDILTDTPGRAYLTARSYLMDLKKSLIISTGDLFGWGGKELYLEAQQKITLIVGGSIIKLDPSGVTIIGAQVNINAGGSGSAAESMIMQDAASPQPADPGDPPDWLEKRPPHKASGAGGDGGRKVVFPKGPVIKPDPNSDILNVGVKSNIDGEEF